MMFEEGFFSIINGDDFENFYSIQEESFTDKNSLKNNQSQKVIKDDLNKKILTKNILAITNGTSH